MNKLIYTADDDENISNLISTFLENEGYTVKSFSTGDSLFEEFIKSPSDLVILDIMMPGTDGLTICKNIRKTSKVPIILLTAKDTDSDYITGITFGSDDYLIKPFRPTLLTVKVKALFRRIEMERGNESLEKNLSFGNITYNSEKRELLCDNNQLSLTSTELKVLLYFLKNKEKAISKDDLLEKIWGQNSEIETRVTDETIRRVRKKMSLCNSSIIIRTIWGFGYKLTLLDENKE